MIGTNDEAYTTGNWSTEVESTAALDVVLNHVGLWTIYHEVPGVLSQPRPTQPGQSMRIDRVLVPNERLIALGWTHGVIGIEAKKSGVKVGPPIAQAMDYGRAVWTLPPAGIKVWLDWVFVWPMAPQHNIIASILSQNRIGCAHMDQWNLLRLKCGEHNIIRVHIDGRIDIGHASNGQKVGSR